MSLTSSSKTKLRFAFAVSACVAVTAALPSCALFGAGGPSLVAQGKYYSSGNPRYDEFFIQLYQLQVAMADAPRVPDDERKNVARALGMSPETPAEGVAQRLREEALKLGRTGLRTRLEQNPAPENPQAASALIRATYRPKDNAAASLISELEASATRLLRSAGEMKAAEVLLAKLEVEVIQLEADREKAFAESHFGKQSEVKKNLSDAQKLITLMKARGQDVQGQSERLLTALAKAVNTDDGSLSAPPDEATEPKAAPIEPKKAQPRPLVKTKGPSSLPAASAPAAAPKPKPNQPAAGDDDAPAKPAAESKPAPAPRDFEP